MLSGPYDGVVTVEYNTANGTANAGSDYETAVGTLTFEPGVTEHFFLLPIVDDTQDEEEETIVLLLANPKNAELGAFAQATAVILDNDTLLPSVPPSVPSIPPSGNLRLRSGLDR